MPHWQLPFLGLRTFPADLTAFEIRYFFTFAPQERKAIFSRHGHQHRLAAALQLGFLKMIGRTLDAFALLPEEVLKHLDDHLGLRIPHNTVPPSATCMAAARRYANTTGGPHNGWAFVRSQTGDSECWGAMCDAKPTTR